MDERKLFINRLLAGERMTDLCDEFGISRKTGYKFAERFARLGEIGLSDQSRAPMRRPTKTTDDVLALVVALRKQHPSWGPRKLKAMLERQHTGVVFPCASTLGQHLSTQGLVEPRRRRRTVPARAEASLSLPQLPNELWCIDFKGQFRLGTGAYCYPLTLTDQASRFLLCCDAFDRIDGSMVQESMTDVFRQFGTPPRIRSDNGAPFATKALLGLSKLSVWWLRHGIGHERITPGCPQQNGRHERMHLTLKQETTRPAAQTQLQQQERFDIFRDAFNRERPHEALAQTPPAQHYSPSSRRFVSTPPEPDYSLCDVVRKVHRGGHAYLAGRHSNTFLSTALEGQTIGLREVAHGTWLVSFMALDLGLYDGASSQWLPADHPDFAAEKEKAGSLW